VEKEQKKQYKLIVEVLRRFNNKGILKNVILIGSWCIPLYKNYFKELKNLSMLRTRDIDLLVPLNSKFKDKIDVAELLKDLGFMQDFFGDAGYIKLIHTDLILEFLVPERGKGSDKPYELAGLGINAQRLRFLDMLTKDTVKGEIEGINIILPHPVSFALHKLLICKRRIGPNKKEKSSKDMNIAIQILNELIKNKDIAPIKGIFKSLHKNWQREIIKVLEAEEEIDIL